MQDITGISDYFPIALRRSNDCLALPSERPELLIHALLFGEGRFPRFLVLPQTTEEEKEALKRRADGCLEAGMNPNPANAPDNAEPLECGNEMRQTVWILCSSGTGGTRKLKAHSLQSLTRTVRDRKPGEQALRWGLAYDPGSFAGMQVILQSLFGGGELVVPTAGEEAEGKIALFARKAISALSATPSFWRRLLMSCGGRHLPLRQLTIGGEAVDQKLLDALRLTFPKAGIRHIYASTEVGVGFSVEDGRAGFPAQWLRTGLPNGGAVAISAHGTLLWAGSSGDDAGGGKLGLACPEVKWQDTGDLVELHDERVFFKGRIDGLINVGGRKVLPETVEAVLLSAQGVALAEVFSKPSPFTGSILAARLELCPGAIEKEVLDSARSLCKARLQPHEQPAFINVVPRLNLNSNGKISRK